MDQLPSDIRRISLYKQPGRPNLEALVALINYIYKTPLGEKFTLDDVSLVVKDSYVRDQGKFNPGDLIFDYHDDFNNKYMGAIVLTNDNKYPGYYETWLFPEDMHFLIPKCVMHACNPDITKSQSMELFKSAIEELDKNGNSADDLKFKQYCEFVVAEDFYKSDENQENLKRQQMLDDIRKKQEKEKISKVKQTIPLNFGGQVIPTDFYLN